MSTDHLIFLSIPGLRTRDIDARRTPTLFGWANRGAMREFTPTFPCVTSSVQATMWTGIAPHRHGVIANGFYHRDRSEVEFWVARNGIIQGEQVWNALRAGRPETTSAVWHAQNIKDAAADFIVTPAPTHEPDGTTKLWCYSKPDDLYTRLIDAFGHFPLHHYWGPMANIESTRWILDAAAWLVEQAAPNFHWIYIPYLDYAGQKYGPNSPQAARAVEELDELLGVFEKRVRDTATGKDAQFLAVGEYALTDVVGVIYPNRVLRDAGLFSVRARDGEEYADLASSAAFAMVDHQFAHVFVNASTESDRRKVTSRVVELFSEVDGIARTLAGADRATIGIEHERSGDVVLVCDDAHWLAYYWWFDDQAAPSFARTVDIHRKPGYDPVELFIDLTTRTISLDATLVRGSHGAPATSPSQRTALICSTPSRSFEVSQTRDTDMKRIVMELLGAT